MGRRVEITQHLALILFIGLAACRDAPADPASSTEAGDSDTGVVEDIPYSGGECQLAVPGDCSDPDLKCMPWSDDVGPPTETRCCQLSSNPVSFSERCTTEDHVNSCIDDCPDDSMCLVDEIDTLTGLCHAFCDADDPNSCPVDELCRVNYAMIESSVDVPTCMARCNPLAQDCESKDRPGWSCLPTGPTAPEFFCAFPTGPTPKLEYEACMAPSDCAPGVTCIPGSQVLGCEGLERCCTSYCELGVDDCTAGNQCADLGSPVPGLESVGLCTIPG